MWYHINADLEKYGRKLRGGGRGYFIKFGGMYTVKRYVLSKNKMDEWIMKQKQDKKSIKSLLDILTNKSSKNPNSALYGLPHHKDDLTSYEKEIIKQLKNDLT